MANCNCVTGIFRSLQSLFGNVQNGEGSSVTEANVNSTLLSAEQRDGDPDQPSPCKSEAPPKSSENLSPREPPITPCQHSSDLEKKSPGLVRRNHCGSPEMYAQTLPTDIPAASIVSPFRSPTRSSKQMMSPSRSLRTPLSVRHSNHGASCTSISPSNSKSTGGNTSSKVGLDIPCVNHHMQSREKRFSVSSAKSLDSSFRNVEDSFEQSWATRWANIKDEDSHDGMGSDDSFESHWVAEKV